MVEGTGLENRHTSNGIVSSNLTLSASGLDALDRGSACQRVVFSGRNWRGNVDGWLSGLRRTPGKCVYVKAYRGFESHPVRSAPVRTGGGAAEQRRRS